jgi:hypothetical protein
MDRLWLMTEAMDALLEDMQSYHNELSVSVLRGQYENPAIVRDHIRQLYRILTKAQRRIAEWRRHCLEGLVIIQQNKERE